MGKKWVQLLTPKHIEHRGEMALKQAGDWALVGKQDALRWLADGSARVPPQRITELMSRGCGILVNGLMPSTLEFVDHGEDLGIEESNELKLPFDMTLMWDPRLLLRPELLPVGFNLLQTWQVAAPLWDYDELACHYGTDGEKERTKAVVRDLRVPLYDTGLVFIKRCGDTRRLVDAWKEELVDDRVHAFLRAVYRTKPLILALPVTWKGKPGPD